MVSDMEVQQLHSRVNELEEKLKRLYQHLNLNYDFVDPSKDLRIIELLRNKKDIEAITLYRSLSNTSLSDAKRAVDDLKARLGY